MSDYFYEPSKGHGLPHNPFKAIVSPRPIGWISSMDEQGRVNLAPYSFFNAFVENPPVIGFCTSGERKDSVNNIDATGEFVANFCSADLAQEMNLTSASVAPGVDEMKLAGLESAASTIVKVPRVARAIAALECKLIYTLQLSNAKGEKINSWLTLGEVVGVHIDDQYLKNGIFDTAAARPLGRCGYRGDYVEVNQLFEMIRPKEYVQK
ncbi:flavin reductase family protein [Orrella sp. NBD-18]|uniref:Flavin reductase family protein n=1 Tax=Sheuella amnicola TaxID=2707330 RepID=A0A6B2R3P1_9BURK|nr:flavin reductase family protein [Sheuella amnicola]NDY84334.1 flavin reductase family protein [Sheuella amnicola]HBI82475.1 Asp/Glu/hydantoin racemase [Alcaligenaceae bacterium]